MRVYVGMDVHRKRSQVALVDEHGGQILNRNLANNSAGLTSILGRLEPGTPVAFEAAYGDRVAKAYPKNAAGQTLFPFRRLFMVAQRKG